MTKSNFNYIIMWMHSAVKEVLMQQAYDLGRNV